MSTMTMMPLQRWASAPARADPVPEATCGICLESDELASLVSLCAGACDTRMCRGCAKAYLEDRAGGSAAYCRRVECPGCRAFVPMAVWTGVADAKTAAAYSKAAGDALTLQCVRCDQRKTLLPVHKPEGESDESDSRDSAGAEMVRLAVEASGDALERHLAGERGAAEEVVEAVNRVALAGGQLEELEKKKAAVEEAIKAGKVAWRKWMGAKGGEIREANTAFRAARKRFGRAKEARRADEESKEAEAEMTEAKAELEAIRAKVRAMRDAKKRELREQEMDKELRELRQRIRDLDPSLALLTGLLRTVEDDERRATLMLAYLRKRPVVRSRCHNHQHCFNCKTANLHDGVTCEENQRRHLPQEVRFCPGCRMPLLKGDGCSSVKCVCGHHFSWHNAEVAQ